MIGTMNHCSANGKVPLALVAFTDKSGKASTKLIKVLENNMLNELIRCNLFEIHKRYPIKEIVEIENGLSVSREEYKSAALNDDFDKVITLTEKDLSRKKENDYIPIEISQKIGKTHGVEYLMHADINFIGTGLHTMALVYQNDYYAHEVPYLEIKATYRLIRVSDGKIIWHNIQSGEAKNIKVNMESEKIGDLAVENKADKSRMILDGTEKLSAKVIKQLRKDMAQKLIDF